MPDAATAPVTTATPNGVAAPPLPTQTQQPDPSVDARIAEFAARERKFVQEQQRHKTWVQQENARIKASTTEFDTQRQSYEADRAARQNYEAKLQAARSDPAALAELMGEGFDPREFVSRYTEKLLNNGQSTPEMEMRSLREQLAAQEKRYEDRFKSFEQKQQEAADAYDREQQEAAQRADEGRAAQTTRQQRIFEQETAAEIRANAERLPLTARYNLAPTVVARIQTHYETTAKDSPDGVGVLLTATEAAAQLEQELEQNILDGIENVPALRAKVLAKLNGTAQQTQTQTQPAARMTAPQTTQPAPSLNNGMTAATPSRTNTRAGMQQKQANLIAKLSGRALPYPDMA